ncbi:hypothetical protein QBC34DRAFT_425943 [Podospora aff. communis PSN243]|uniref:RNase H type-1 domain-containing protein n=1 Tax=Podospora aff. communis PSN243 TaxID=3040156 RepID=A0AAV9GLI0_9PEZI|nr:hypothetical protein QBC34DRAFT_425943 [Podospora aff. communis PSN243]
MASGKSCFDGATRQQRFQSCTELDRRSEGTSLLPVQTTPLIAGKFTALNMEARLQLLNELQRSEVADDVRKAVDHASEMMHLDPDDSMGVKDIYPGLLLRLGHEQKCYEFLHRISSIDANNIRKAVLQPDDMADCISPDNDAFEKIDVFCQGPTSLAHLATLALLKLRIRLDLQSLAFDRKAYTTRYDERPERYGRPLGKINILLDKEKANFDRGSDQCAERLTPELRDAATRAVGHCYRAWHDTRDAIRVVEDDVQCLHPKSSVLPGGPAVPESQPHALITKRPTMSGTKSWGTLPVMFDPHPEGLSSLELFPPTPFRDEATSRLVHHADQKTLLVFADGFCTESSALKWDAQGGWAVTYGMSSEGAGCTSGTLFGRLELQGPSEERRPETPDRAELRALIAAMRGCDWLSEGFSTLVIATSYTYVADSAGAQIKGWIENDLMTESGKEIDNFDLWDTFLVGPSDLVNNAEPRRILELSDAWWSEGNGGIWDALASKPNIEVRHVSNDPDGRSEEEVAFSELRQTTPLSGIILMNTYFVGEKVYREALSSGLDRPEAEKRMEPRCLEFYALIMRHLRAGATVILTDHCDASEVCRLAGVPWRVSDTYSVDTVLRPQAVGEPLSGFLPKIDRHKSCLVENVDPSDLWYIDEEDLKTEGEVTLHGTSAFTKVGLGQLGYIGDSNCGAARESLFLAMFGLLDRALGTCSCYHPERGEDPDLIAPMGIARMVARMAAEGDLANAYERNYERDRAEGDRLDADERNQDRDRSGGSGIGDYSTADYYMQLLAAQMSRTQENELGVMGDDDL